MSIQAVGWVLDQTIPDSASKLVLISIANALNGKTGKCCPSLDLIAHESSVSRSTVIRKLKTLEAEGWITIAEAFTVDGRQTSNTYSINYNPQSSQVEGEGVMVTLPEGVTAMEPSGVSTVTPLDEPEEGTLPPNAPQGGLKNDLFEKVWNVWPEAMRGDRETAGGAFGRLMPESQQQLHDCLPGAATALAARAGRGLVRFPRLSTFIARDMWRQFVDAPELVDGYFKITPKREEWKAWMGWARGQRGQAGVDYYVKLGYVLSDTREPPNAA
jgi:hypothetical protein